jgi:hypothetical protein
VTENLGILVRFFIFFISSKGFEEALLPLPLYNQMQKWGVILH